jgi:hypothetical protein
MSTPFYDLASLVVVPSGYKAAKIYAQKPLTTDGQLAFTRASTATRVNASGLIETVASGVPRLDYLGSTCPKLLLEPQRSNLNPYSEQFDNAGWEKLNATITANATTSPDGFTNADAWLETSASGQHRLYDDGISVTSGTAYTCSLFVKPNGRNWVAMEFFAAGGGFNGSRVWFNIANGTIGTTQTGITAKIENYGNGWYRISATQTAAATTTGYILYLLATGDGVFSYAGDVTKGAFVYGGMTEAGAYATSYIPTLGASVTRVADAASKTGISSLIGQTEGTIFFDLPPTTFSDLLSTYVLLEVDGDISVGYIHLYKEVGQKQARFAVRNAGITQCDIFFTLVDNTAYKIAAVYKNNRFELYVNGVLRASDTSGTLASITMNKMQVCGDSFNPNSQLATKQVLLFKTALTQAQCIELTA